VSGLWRPRFAPATGVPVSSRRPAYSIDACFAPASLVPVSRRRRSGLRRLATAFRDNVRPLVYPLRASARRTVWSRRPAYSIDACFAPASIYPFSAGVDLGSGALPQNFATMSGLRCTRFESASGVLDRRMFRTGVRRTRFAPASTQRTLQLSMHIAPACSLRRARFSLASGIPSSSLRCTRFAPASSLRHEVFHQLSPQSITI
jgi:hypothetical protein